MMDWFFGLSAAVAASCFAGFIIISVIGSILEKRMKADEYGRAEDAMKKISFALFLGLGFSIVPVMVGLFIPALKTVVPVPIDVLEKNDMLIVFAFWTAYAIGLIILLPTIKKDFFGQAGKSGGGGGDGAQAARLSGEGPPVASLPTLDQRIRGSGAVVLASTGLDGDSVVYTVEEVWKSPRTGSPYKAGKAALIITAPFEGRGYTPVDRQRIVFFTSGKPPHEDLVELLPVIGDYVMYAPADTGVQEYLALGDLKKRVLGLKP